MPDRESIELLGRKRKLLIILCAAFAVRSIQLLLICSISGDNPVYIEMAQNFFTGDFKAGLAEDYQTKSESLSEEVAASIYNTMGRIIRLKSWLLNMQCWNQYDD